jgi:hypothetical protein
VIKSKKLRDSARGRDCELRLTGTCNHNSATTVLAHIGHGGGVSIKCSDTMAVFACSDCHDVIDGRVSYSSSQNPNIEEDKLRALEATQSYWIREGLLKV